MYYNRMTAKRPPETAKGERRIYDLYRTAPPAGLPV